jgi:hypothetical protein
MKFDELKTLFASKGVHVVPVQGYRPRTAEHSRVDLGFAGTLDEFLASLEPLQCKVAFVSRMRLDQEDLSDPPENEGEDPDEEAWKRALRTAERDSESKHGVEYFSKFIGQDGYFEVSIATRIGVLAMQLTEPWWDEFTGFIGNAAQIYEEILEESAERRDAADAVHDASVLKQLDALDRDPKFIKLRTQAAMYEYACQQIPELLDVDETAVKAHIRRLAAKLQAEGKRN